VGQQIHGDTPPDIGQLRQLVAPEVAIEEYTMDEQCYWSPALFQIVDASRWSLNLLPLCDWFVPFHGLASLCHCGGISFHQFLGAVLAADLDCSSADLDLDDIGAQLAITGCASSFRHDLSPIPKFV
jgi:hypothetical protein